MLDGLLKAPQRTQNVPQFDLPFPVPLDGGARQGDFSIVEATNANQGNPEESGFSGRSGLAL
ncbi:hypothetical protein Q0N68_13850, partial [Staphylococcus aureus]|nr:hypothetical protein [Staphylococcus aureus]